MLEGTSVTEPPVNWIVLPETEIGLTALEVHTYECVRADVGGIVDGGFRTMMGAALSTAVPAVKLDANAGPVRRRYP